MFWKYLGYFFLSMVKFIFTPFLAAKTIPEGNWFFTFLTVALGGIISCTFFYFSATYFIEKRVKKNLEKGKQRKKFTRMNKFIIKIKKKLGVFGLALLTASFISIPLGSIITAKFYRHDSKTIIILYTAIIAVAGLLTFIAYLF